MLRDLFANGHIVDCILGFMLVETIVLIIIRKNGRPVFDPWTLVVNAGAGAALLLALRAALRHTEWYTAAIWLAVGLLFHLWDVMLRWSKRRAG